MAPSKKQPRLAAIAQDERIIALYGQGKYTEAEALDAYLRLVPIVHTIPQSDDRHRDFKDIFYRSALRFLERQKMKDPSIAPRLEDAEAESRYEIGRGSARQMYQNGLPTDGTYYTLMTSLASSENVFHNIRQDFNAGELEQSPFWRACSLHFQAEVRERYAKIFRKIAIEFPPEEYRKWKTDLPPFVERLMKTSAIWLQDAAKLRSTADRLSPRSRSCRTL